jgi:riboflavin kinase / FMN adenylyltransferase
MPRSKKDLPAGRTYATSRTVTEFAFTRIDASSSDPAPGAAPAVLVIGNFDGVHRGHRAVLALARDEADRRGLRVAVLTFDPHPAAVLGRGVPPQLTTLQRKSQLILRCGVDAVYAHTFELAFAAWSPERFARVLVRERLRAEVVVVGDNFRFGAKRAGDLAMLRALGASIGFDAHAHDMAADGKGTFSSTRTRAALAAADVDEAALVLGRPHAFSGVVGRGDQRGRTIGFATANVEEVEEIVPPNGVYAVVVDEIDDAAPEGRALAKGVMNVGVRPTVGGEGRRTQEVHLFDFAGDLYGRTLRVHLIARLREERRFAGLDALKAQIASDAAEARVRLASVEPAFAQRGRYG